MSYFSRLVINGLMFTFANNSHTRPAGTFCSCQGRNSVNENVEKEVVGGPSWSEESSLARYEPRSGCFQGDLLVGWRNKTHSSSQASQLGCLAESVFGKKQTGTVTGAGTGAGTGTGSILGASTSSLPQQVGQVGVDGRLNAQPSTQVPTRNLLWREEIFNEECDASSNLYHLLGNETTTTTIGHSSHAQTSSRPSTSMAMATTAKSETTTNSKATQTELNFSLNDYSTNTCSNNNDNSAPATSDNWPTTLPQQVGRRRPPAEFKAADKGGVTWSDETQTTAGHFSSLLRAGFIEELAEHSQSSCSSSNHLNHFDPTGARNGSSEAPEDVSRRINLNRPSRVCAGNVGLRVCIKVPQKVHKIIIVRKPKVTFATTTNQL